MSDGYVYNTQIGYVVGGSLQEGIRAILFPDALLACGNGTFVVLIGKHGKSLALIADISLHISSNVSYLSDKKAFHLLELVHADSSSYQAIMYILWEFKDAQTIVRATSIPECFSYIYKAEDTDILTVWNHANRNDIYFPLGVLKGTQTEITMPLKALARRSNAVFGKTGTGKTFVSRYLVGAMIAKKVAAFLIFDMHSEYAYSAMQEHSKKKAEGLKMLFPGRVLVATLDNRSSKKIYDLVIKIPLDMIRIEDVLALQRELSLHPTACEAAYLLYAKFSTQWLSVLMNNGSTLVDLAKDIGAHVESLSALHRKLKRIADLPFVTPEKSSESVVVLSTIIQSLEKGISVVVEFGLYNQTLSYLFVANVLTRMLHDARIKKTESFLDNSKEEEPVQIVIVIEEAHKFLHPSIAQQTAFGMIAREMRKYYVSLLVIDQRPSHIDDEILSQLGTKFLLSLSDSRDCDAVLSGVEKASHIKQIIESLASKQEVVVVGHTAPLPVKIRVADYSSLSAYSEYIDSKKVDSVLAALF